MNAVRDALIFLQGEFEAPWSVWEGHTCPVGRPVTLREWALNYAAERLSRGYTVAQAEAESNYGQSSACEPGFEISHGILFVGGSYGAKDKNSPRRFVFADLVRELTANEIQTNLFGVAA